MAVEPTVLESRRDMAGGDRQHPVGEPHGQGRGQVMEDFLFPGMTLGISTPNRRTVEKAVQPASDTPNAE